jgi:hypothetical protein
LIRVAHNSQISDFVKLYILVRLIANLFTTVPNAETGGLLNPNDFDANSWRRLVESGAERYVFDEEDENGVPVPLSELDEEWLSERERER